MSQVRPNVAEQNGAIADEIARLTDGLRERTAGYPDALYTLLAEHGILVEHSVLASVSTAEQGSHPVTGILVTQDGRFIDFDLSCDRSGKVVEDLHNWEDVTDSQNLSAHNAGFGKSRSCIALEVLRRSGHAG